MLVHTDGRAFARASLLALLSGLLAHGCTFKSEIQASPSGIPDGDVVTPPPYVVTITQNGVSPNVLHVWQDGKATFVNDDTRPHTIAADPHPGHHECKGILNLGSLKPGERRDVVDLLPNNACFFHDEADPGNRSFQGALVTH